MFTFRCDHIATFILSLALYPQAISAENSPLKADRQPNIACESLSQISMLPEDRVTWDATPAKKRTSLALLLDVSRLETLLSELLQSQHEEDVHDDVDGDVRDAVEQLMAPIVELLERQKGTGYSFNYKYHRDQAIVSMTVQGSKNTLAGILNLPVVRKAWLAREFSQTEVPAGNKIEMGNKNFMIDTMSSAKTVTVRSGTRDVVEGPGVAFWKDKRSGETFELPIVIERVESVPFDRAHISHSHLKGENPGVTFESLLEGLKNWHPGFDEGSLVSVITYRFVGFDGEI